MRVFTFAAKNHLMLQRSLLLPIKSHVVIWLSVFLLVFLQTFTLSTVQAAQETPQSFTFDGRAYADSSGASPLLDANVLFKVQILNPGQDCVLYEEQQTVSTLMTNGYFNISVGSVASDSKRTTGGGALDSNNEMNSIFSNTQISVPGKKLSDGSACTYTPASGDKKYVRMQMTPSSDAVTRTLSPMMALDSVPNAVVAERAESLQGLAPSQFLQMNNGGGVALTQANLESVFSSTNYTRLSTLVSVPPTNYVQTGINGSATIPSVAGNPGAGLANGQIWYDSGSNSLKYYNGSVQVLATGSGTVSSVTGTSPISVASGTSTPVISISKATSAVSGYLSSSDWTLFNSKLSNINSTDVTTALGYTPADNSASWSTDGTNVYRQTGNVGVGTVSPGYKLDVIGQSRVQSDTGPAYNIVQTANAGANIGSGVALLRSRGTVGSPTFPQSGDTLGAILLSNHQAVTGASITAVAAENQSGLAGGTDLKFSTTQNGTATLPVRMIILNDGNVGVGTTTPGYKLDVVGDVNVSGNFKVNGVDISSGTVTSVTGTSPISVATGTNTPVISISKANATTNGYLSSADWSIFNNKLSSINSTDVTTALGFSPLSNALTSAYLFVGNGSNVATGVQLSGDATLANTGVLSLANTATARSNLGLGTASVYNVPVAGDAGAGQVVKGDDSRLVDGRAPIGTASGDLTGSYPAPTLKTTGVGAGTYTKVTVDTKGRVITGASIDSSDVTTALGYTPANNSASWSTDGTNVYRTSGNVGIGTSTPNVSALLDLTSTTKGLLMPRMTSAQRTAIASPIDGLTVYDTDFSTFYFYNGASWVAVAAGGGAVNSVNNQSGSLTVVAGSSAASSDFTVTTTGSNITLNLPTASSTVRGALSSADWSVFNNKVSLTTVYSGDVSGNASTTSVDKIKGKTISPVAYATNQYLRYDGTNWVNSLLVSTDVTTALGFSPLSNALTSGNIFVGNGSNVATGVQLSGDATLANTGVLSLSNTATARSNLGLGTASVYNVPVAGDAGAGQVVKGDDSRLVDGRAPIGAASGDLTGTYPAPSLTATGVGAGTYTKVTVDTKGRVTAATSIASSDITTALGYTPANNSASWSTDGTNVYRTTGNVGVGTSTPAYPLTVAGSTIGLGTGVLSLSSTGVSVGNGNNLGSTSPPSVAMGSGNTADVGSVAIGKNNTTLIGIAADAVAIGLGNSVPRDSATAVGKNNSVGGNGYFSLAAGYSNSVSGTNGVAVGYSNTVSADGASAFGQSITNSIANTTQIGPSNTAKVTIDSSGNVGVGTTTPAYKLDVIGDVNISGNFKMNGVNINSGTVTSVTGTSPISVATGTNTPVISIAQSNATTNGYLSSSDWTTFSNKLSNALTSAYLFVGNGSNIATGVQLSGDATLANTGVLSLANTATARSNLGLGTASVYNVPVTGDAGPTQVVKGDDSRLIDGRAPIGTASGDLTGTYPAPSLTATGVGAGTYTKVTVDTKGRVTAATSIASSDITSALGFTPANDSSAWSTDGTNVYRMTGNVGVGTSTPGYRLHVPWKSGDSATTTYFGGLFSGNNQTALTATSESGNSIYAESTYGFGVVAKTSANTNAAIKGESLGTATGVLGNSFGGGYGVSGESNTSSAGVFSSNYGSNTAATLVTKLYTGQSTAVSLFEAQDSGGAALFKITGSGNVGIGTTTPARLLHVNGPMRMTAAALPGTPGTGDLAVDSGDSNKLKWYDGSSWQNAGGAAASSVAASSGTAGAPSISFSGDSDTGFYSAAANTIGVAAAGSNIFNLSSSGIVAATTGGGVMTTANGTAGAPTFSFAGDTGTGWWRPATSTIAVSTGGTERMRMDSSGNVGIGTSTPSSKLHIFESGAGVADVLVQSVNNDATLTLNPYPGNNTAAWRLTGSSSSAKFQLKDVWSAYSPFQIEQGAGSSAFYIKSGGNVGIGTNTPAHLLSVVTTGDTKNGLYVDGSSLVSQQALQIVTSLPVSSITGRAFTVGNASETYSRGVFYANGTYGIGPGSSTRDVFIGRYSANTLQVGSSYDLTGSANLAVMGNVGIGTSTPNAVLGIVGTNVSSGNASTVLSVVGGSTSASGKSGGAISLTAGNSTTGGTGGAISITTGAGVNFGGDLNLTAGNGTGVGLGYGGNTFVTSGGGKSIGGDIAISGGWLSGQQYGGSVTIDGALGSTTNGSVKIGTAVNTDVIFATAGGKVGIGTSSPGALLDVNGTMRVSQICDSTGANCKTVSSGWNASAGMSALTAAAATNTIDNTNYAQIWDWSTATTQNPMSMSANSLTTGSLLNLTSSSGSLNSANGLLYVANTSASTTGEVARIQSNSTAGSGLTVLANGNVGIGTSTPSVMLDIVGTGGVRYNRSGGAATVMMTDYSSSFPMLTLAGNDITVPGYINSLGALRLYAGGANPGSGSAKLGLSIDTSGKVGIGTSTPSAQLEIDSGAAANKGLIVRGYASQTANLFEIQNSSGTQLVSINASGDTMNFANGAIQMGTGNLVNMGRNNTVANNSQTIGSNNTAIADGGGTGGTAMGYGNNTGSASQGLAMGRSNTATSDNGVAMGGGNTAGSSGVAMGLNTTATTSAVAVGISVNNGTSGTLQIGPSNTAKVAIDASGNVGIGTTTPSYNLEINTAAASTMKIASTVSSSSIKIVKNSGSSYSAGIDFGTGATSNYLIGTYGTNADFNMGTSLSSPQVMIQRTTGYMGVGTTTPARLLHVEGPMRMTASALPGTPGTGDLAVDSGDSNKLKWYDGSTWQAAGSSIASSVAASIGSAGAPSISFSGDSDTGFYSPGVLNTIGVSTGGANIFNLSSSGIVAATTGGGVMTTANGTAAAPTFSFAGDTGTGWWRPATSTVAVSTGGTERMRIDLTGNVGIGTSTPASPLTVVGIIESKSGGIKFPDGTTQTTAASGGSVAYGSVSRSTGFTISASNTWYDLTLDTDGPLSGVTHAASAANVVVSAAGTYSVSFSLYAHAGANLQTVCARVLKNGATAISGSGRCISVAPGYDGPISSSTILTLAASDTLNISVKSDNTTASLVVNAGPDSAILNVQRLGP